MRQNEVAWFYEPGSFRPLARQSGGELLYILTDHLGTPKEMVEENGRIRWAADHDTWGTVRQCRTWKSPEAVEETGYVLTSKGDIGVAGNTALARQVEPDPLLCPIRFQGQWEDAETGLYYNRARYYDPVAAAYSSSDPIGILGGLCSSCYVPTPNSWIDPSGLTGIYIFRTDAGTCYVGKGPETRMTQSMVQRAGTDGSLAAANQESTRAATARGCCASKHFDLTGRGARHGISDNTFAQMVENQLLDITGAKSDSRYANVKFDGQAAFANNPGAQQAATSAAEAAMRRFDSLNPGHGCW